MAAPDLTIKQGDTWPPLAAILSDANGPIDLSTATTIEIWMKGISGTVVSGLCTPVDAAAGSIIYSWGPTDTAVPDTYNVEFEITWSGGGEETVPNDSYRQ